MIDGWVNGGTGQWVSGWVGKLMGGRRMEDDGWQGNVAGWVLGAKQRNLAVHFGGVYPGQQAR